MKKLSLLLSLTMAIFAQAQVRQPEWANKAVIYEVNVRQFSQSGKLSEVTKNLDRLQNLGVDILWLMPLHPIGMASRKGTMGSYYSVRDYRGIDTVYGTVTDMSHFVKTAKTKGLKVIIDWVANHTAWDHPWITEHKDWYVQDSLGNIVTQYDWTDVAKLNYNNQAMRHAMIEDMKYWVQQFGIDGFRCDVAFLVPADFWREAKMELEKIKPIYMLAEMEWNTDLTENPSIFFQTAFNAAYGWTFMGVTQDMAKGKKNLNDFRKEMKENYDRFPRTMHKLFYITNHDENSWNGTVAEKYGDNWKLYSALTYTMPQSLPLMYTGEECGLNRRLQFFEKDPITKAEWSDTSRYAWYRSLTTLKHSNPALWSNGTTPAEELTWSVADTLVEKSVYAFKRKSGNAEVVVLINFSDKEMKVKPTNWEPVINNLISNKPLTMNKKKELILPPFSVNISSIK